MRGEVYFHSIGWALFVVCSLFYIASAVRAGDLLSLLGGVLFFLGCVAFIIPLAYRIFRRQEKE